MQLNGLYYSFLYHTLMLEYRQKLVEKQLLEEQIVAALKYLTNTNSKEQ